MDSHLAALLLQYRWEFLVPLSFIESPIVAFISGTLASLGYFNLFALAAYFFVKDVVFDAGFYYMGYRGARTKFVHRMLKRFSITPEHFDDVRREWELRPMRTMLLGKVSYGVAMGFIVAAGAVRMSLKKFFLYGAIAAVLQYWTLLLLGYFFGAAFGSLTGIVTNLEYVVAFGGLLLSGYYILAWYLRRRSMNNHHD